VVKTEAILVSVDESFIVTGQTSEHAIRRIPTFWPEEISLGPILGRDGFGVVHEIAKFTLDYDKDDNNNNDGASGDSPLEAGGTPAATDNTTTRSTTTRNGER
jgi:hypothetical protein